MLEKVINSIKGLDAELMVKAQMRLDSLTKPLGSLGKLEEIAKRIVGITGKYMPEVNKKNIVIMCSDNGVYEEGVSSCPQNVTAAVTRNFTRGITGINVLSKHSGAEITIVDLGVIDDVNHEKIINKKIRRGTWNITKGPAMTKDEALKALMVGIDTVSSLKTKGVNLLGTGEMGVGNTTTSSAVAAVLTGSPVDKLVGKGAGLSNEGLVNKINVIKKAIEINKPDPADAIDVLAKLGGFDIAGMAGCFIGAAVNSMPIVVDGFISMAAALVAVKIEPKVAGYLFLSHSSAEPGTHTIIESLGQEPLLNLGMRLGEGTGAALAFHIIDAAVSVYKCMGTFEDAEIMQYVPQE